MAGSNFSELGVSGLQRYGGYVQEEFLRELTGTRWARNVREMTWNDPVIAAAFFAFDTLTRQVTWDVQAASDDNADLEIADFVRGALHDMSQSWTETVAEIHSYLPWGWSLHEIVYKRRRGEARDPGDSSAYNDNKIGWRKWPIRAQESLDRWAFDDSGGVQGMYQRPAPDYQERFVPIEKALLFRTTQHKNNPEGRSLCRPIFRPYFFKQRIENIEGIGIERDLAGLPVLYVPGRIMQATSGDDLTALNYCKNLVTGIRNDEQGGALLSSERDESGNLFYELKLLSTGGARAFDTNRIIQRYNQTILMTLMADFLLLGHEKVGSFALASSKTQMFSTALGAFLDSDCEVINRYAIPRLLRLNGMPAINPPKLTHGDIESVDLMELGEFIAKLSGAGVKLSPEILGYSLEQAGLPVPDDPDELAEMAGQGREDDENEEMIDG